MLRIWMQYGCDGNFLCYQISLYCSVSSCFCWLLQSTKGLTRPMVSPFLWQATRHFTKDQQSLKRRPTTSYKIYGGGDVNGWPDEETVTGVILIVMMGVTFLRFSEPSFFSTKSKDDSLSFVIALVAWNHSDWMLLNDNDY